MALGDIIERIKDDSAVEVERIVSEARAKADEMLAEAEREGEELRTARLAEAEAGAETIRRRILAQARLAARDEVLACKQAAVDRVFAGLGEKLASLNRESYGRLMEKLMVERASGAQEVLPAAADAGIVDAALVERANRRLSESGSKDKLQLGPTTDEIERGFMLRAGRILTNCSLEVLLSEARRQFEDQVYDALFGEDDKRSEA